MRHLQPGQLKHTGRSVYCQRGGRTLTASACPARHASGFKGTQKNKRFDFLKPKVDAMGYPASKLQRLFFWEHFVGTLGAC